MKKKQYQNTFKRFEMEFLILLNVEQVTDQTTTAKNKQLILPKNSFRLP